MISLKTRPFIGRVFFIIGYVKPIVDFGTLLTGTEGAKTPAGGSPDRPRKAKRLEWKSTRNFLTNPY
ncbi:hypothetical protein [Neobacillus drentensis]|uniref:hypothetical protein n=1 Tax=Neobacillus drentensis TaxID=220684 RepID=UPI003000FB20